MFHLVLMRGVGVLISLERKQGLGIPRWFGSLGMRLECGLPIPLTSTYHLCPPCVSPSCDELLHSKPRDYFMRGHHW